MAAFIVTVNHFFFPSDLITAGNPGSFPSGCEDKVLDQLVFEAECTGHGLSPEPCTLIMQLPFPPLRGSNQRSVHVMTDRSQISLFQGFFFQPFCSVLFVIMSFEPVSHSCSMSFIFPLCQSQNCCCCNSQISLNILDSNL